MYPSVSVLLSLPLDLCACVPLLLSHVSIPQLSLNICPCLYSSPVLLYLCFCPFVKVPTYLSLRLCPFASVLVYLSSCICPRALCFPLHLPSVSVPLSMSLCMCPSVADLMYLSLRSSPSISVPVSVSLLLSLYLCLFVSVPLSLSLCLCPFVSVPLSLSLCRCLCISVPLSISQYPTFIIPSSSSVTHFCVSLPLPLPPSLPSSSLSFLLLSFLLSSIQPRNHSLGSHCRRWLPAAKLNSAGSPLSGRRRACFRWAHHVTGSRF